MEKDRRQLVGRILDIGERLLESGAEVGRVEDTMQRIGLAYGFDRIDVFTITSSIYMTAGFGGDSRTETRRIKKIGVDMEKIVQINELSRRICASPLSVEELSEKIRELDGVRHYSSMQITATYFVVAAAFTALFGGDLADMAAAGIASLILRLLETTFKKLSLHNFALYFINSFIVGTVIYILTGFGLGEAYDKIVMANIMLLIPGVGLTTAIRDMITGDMLSGILGFLAAVIQAVAIGLGFAAAAALLLT